MARTSQVEEQVRQHGYSIHTVVTMDGVAVVTLKDIRGGNSFKADSGQDTGPTRYQTALAIATDRMLDYEYRITGGKPNLGESLI